MRDDREQNQLRIKLSNSENNVTNSDNRIYSFSDHPNYRNYKLNPEYTPEKISRLVNNEIDVLKTFFHVQSIKKTMKDVNDKYFHTWISNFTRLEGNKQFLNKMNANFIAINKLQRHQKQLLAQHNQYLKQIQKAIQNSTDSTPIDLLISFEQSNLRNSSIQVASSSSKYKSVQQLLRCMKDFKKDKKLDRCCQNKNTKKENTNKKPNVNSNNLNNNSTFISLVNKAISQNLIIKQLREETIRKKEFQKEIQNVFIKLLNNKKFKEKLEHMIISAITKIINSQDFQKRLQNMILNIIQRVQNVKLSHY